MIFSKVYENHIKLYDHNLFPDQHLNISNKLDFDSKRNIGKQVKY